MRSIITLFFMTVFALYGAERMGWVTAERLLPAPIGNSIHAGATTFLAEINKQQQQEATTPQATQNAIEAEVATVAATTAKPETSSFTNRIAARNDQVQQNTQSTHKLISAF